MAKIHFTHNYPKLDDGKGNPVQTADLLDVFIVKLETMSPEFLNYDTDNGSFPLPSTGVYMMLILLKPDKRNVFTTLRSLSSLDKFKYYKSMIGRRFIIEVHGE